MKNVTFLMLMAFGFMLLSSFTINDNSLISKGTSGRNFHRSARLNEHPLVGKTSSTKTLKKATATIYLYRGPNVSGSWVIEFSGPSGTFTYNMPMGNSTTPPIPDGTYNYVGIHAIGGSSGSYSFSGSACTYSYSSSGSSALFTNVPLTCGGGSFSVN